MSHPKVKLALAGVEAGVLGGLVMLLALGVSSVLERDAWWSYGNLLGATFYGSRVLRSGVGWATAAGVSWQLVLAGAAGALFAVTFGRTPGVLRAVLSVAWGALLFYVSRAIYRTFAPLVALYAPDTSMLLAHMLFGVFLARVRLPPAAAARPGAPDPLPAAPEALPGSEMAAGMPVVSDVPGRTGQQDSSGRCG